MGGQVNRLMVADLELAPGLVVEAEAGFPLELDPAWKFEGTSYMLRLETQLYSATLDLQVEMVASVSVMVVQSGEA